MLRSSGVFGVATGTELELPIVCDRDLGDFGDSTPSRGSVKLVGLIPKSLVIRTWYGDRTVWILVVVPLKASGTAPNIISAISSMSPT